MWLGNLWLSFLLESKALTNFLYTKNVYQLEYHNLAKLSNTSNCIGFLLVLNLRIGLSFIRLSDEDIHFIEFVWNTHNHKNTMFRIIVGYFWMSSCLLKNRNVILYTYLIIRNCNFKTKIYKCKSRKKVR